ncbi:MAG: hypothetical protein K0R57_4381 [Paenibacillaceae bacterium]|jgi:hypothetical protein|nr:hypothetical protein [Paenibacillaceae bacterium]
MKAAAFFRRHSFILLLLALFLAADWGLARWNPMETSRRFYKNDFTKTLYHHDWSRSGPVFYGNSAVTGAYMEERSGRPLTEMGLSYGRITDLKGILDNRLYEIKDELVLGIDVHTMIDDMETDPTYQWFRRPYEPYVYEYRDYFRDSGTELVKNLYKGSVELDRSKLLAYEPRWIDKELYFGRKDNAWMKERWDYYDQRWGGLQPADFRENLEALEWVMDYAREHQLAFKVVWMPWNKDFPKPPYVEPLRTETNRMLQAGGVPVLDLMDRYEATYFHDLVHLNREDGAPLFTKEVDEWLGSFAKPSNS